MLSDYLRRHITGLEKLLGWCTPEKAAAMMELVVETRPALCVEIGVFGGRSLAATAMALRDNRSGVVYGIDPFSTTAALEGEKDQANLDWWGRQDLGAVHESCCHFLTTFWLWRHVRLLHAAAHDVAGMFTDGSIDILHIDGNHSELASCRDVELYMPKVRPGGHVWFDDTDWKSTTAAQEILGGMCATIKDVGNCRLYRKAA